MIWLAPLAFIAWLGFVTVLRLTRTSVIAYKPLFFAAVSLPIGFSICSFALFLAYLVDPNQGFFIAVTAVTTLTCFLTLGLLRTTSHEPLQPQKKFSWLDLFKKWQDLSRTEKTIFLLASGLFILSLLRACSVYQSVSLSNIFGGWDARFFWNVKAKFLFRSPSEWQNMFAADLDWAHPDYPLLIPGAVAWGWLWTGKELQIWPALVAFSFYLSFAFWITWFLCASTKLANGLLGGAFFMSVGCILFWSVSQYADIPLAYFITASASLLIAAFRAQEYRLLLLSAWLAGCAAWSKNEGMLFLVWFAAAFASLHGRAFFNFAETRKKIILLAWGLALPLGCVFILKTVLAPHGDYLGSGRGLREYIAAILGDIQKTKTILTGFGVYLKSYSNWNGLWFLFLTALLSLGITRRFRAGQTGYLAGVALLILAGYFVVLHTSPHNIVFQIQTALDRLLIHAAGPAILFIFETFGKIASGNSSENKQ